MSKIQSDNQMRFQDLEKVVQSGEINKKITKKVKTKIMRFYQVVQNLKI